MFIYVYVVNMVIKSNLQLWLHDLSIHSGALTELSLPFLIILRWRRRLVMLVTYPFIFVKFIPIGCGLRVVACFIVPLSRIALACYEFIIAREFWPVEN